MKSNIKKLKHDIKSIFSRVYTSIDLLKDYNLDEDYNQILEILENSSQRLELIYKIFMFYLFKDTPLKKEKVNIAYFFNVKESFYVNFDKYFIKIFVETINALNKEGFITAKVEGNNFLLEGKFNQKDEIDRLFVKFLYDVSKMIHVKLEISESKIKLIKEK